MDDADRTAAGLRLGFVPGVTLTRWRRTWGERYPRTPLQVTEIGADQPRAALDADRFDLCFARLPIERDGVHVIPLYEEQPVVVAPKDHPVAAFETVALADVAEELIDLETGADPFGPDAAVDPFDLVAGGHGLLLVPQSVARSGSRRDLVHRPVTDAEPTTIGLCWRREDPHPLTDDFVGVVRGRTVNSSRTTQTGGTPPARKDRPRTDPGRSGRPARRRRR